MCKQNIKKKTNYVNKKKKMAFAAARMILKDKRRKSKEEYVPPTRTRSKVINLNENVYVISNGRHPMYLLYEIRSNIIIK